MGIANLGGVQFRIDPDAIAYDYTVDYSVIDTLGGRVIQVLGATIGDITIQGHFGQDHQHKRESWQLAESFGVQIRSLMDRQVLPPKNGQSGGTHQPLRFTYLDGTHNWDMQVLIKSYGESDGQGSIEHRSGKFSYGYKLTLFLVQDSSLTLSRVQSDKFISRISKGLGWSDTHLSGQSFEGSDTLTTAMQYIEGHSIDGSYKGYVAGLLTGQTNGPATGSGAPAPTAAPGSDPNKQAGPGQGQ
jgi:hypothetical protein